MSWVRNLYRSYGDFSIDLPELEILDEGVTSLWGPSGAGKTSVFRLLLGLDQCSHPTRNESNNIGGRREFTWMFNDVDLARLSPPQRKLGVVFQTLDLFPHLSARGNILFGAEARRIPRDQAQKKLAELTENLNLNECIDRKVHLLSGGEKQRVALARALIGRPRILFLDEPFSALDSDLRATARELVKRVIKAEQVPTVLITHDRSDLEVFGGKVSEIQSGRLQREFRLQ